jgi:hypothetical protein
VTVTRHTTGIGRALGIVSRRATFFSDCNRASGLGQERKQTPIAALGSPIATVTPIYCRMSDDAVLLLLLAAPLGIPAIASFLLPDRVSWILVIGVVLAGVLVVVGYAATGGDTDGEWDTSTRVAFGFLVAAPALLVWFVGSAFGWASGRARLKSRQGRRHSAS